MIIQCEACQTRFRLAVEKVKPGGTKVRCSKCKSIFTVLPPAPEPVEEAVDFGAFNMERVTEDTSAEPAPAAEGYRSEEPDAVQPTTPPAQPESPSEAPAPQEDGDLDFSAFEDEMGGESERDAEFSDDIDIDGISLPDEGTESGTEAASGAYEFSFDEAPRPSGEPGDRLEPESPEQEPAGPAEFSFNDEDDALAFSFDDKEDAAKPVAAEDFTETGEFSFDDDEPFGEGAAEGWSSATTDADDSAFDFEEPRLNDESSSETGATAATEQGGLQFGEIDFASDHDEPVTTPGVQAGGDVFRAGEGMQDEPEHPVQKPQTTSQSTRGYDLDEPIPKPRAQKKKSSLSRILALLILLLAVLGGAAGYLYVQEGALNLNTVANYLPFLKEYLGEPPPAAPGDRIGINISGSSYVNGKAGQMLVIQGAAVNNHPKTRSAITIKGVLLDAQGKKLLQQTVFCGNKLDEAALKSMPFAAIEEAMNNQFGDSLSNMNVAAGAAIPFTIVFRNLPAGIANINVEVVDSKPGAG